jgi:uncharacterized paraquat-inducible protein A
MLFRNSPTNRPIRLVAALVAICFLVAFAVTAGLPLNALAVPIAVLAAWLALHTILAVVQNRRPREDPYDLRRLWDETPPDSDEPEEDADDRDLAYCHRCGASLPKAYAVCPDCGNRLGH